MIVNSVHSLINYFDPTIDLKKSPFGRTLDPIDSLIYLPIKNYTSSIAKTIAVASCVFSLAILLGSQTVVSVLLYKSALYVFSSTILKVISVVFLAILEILRLLVSYFKYTQDSLVLQENRIVKALGGEIEFNRLPRLTEERISKGKTHANQYSHRVDHCSHTAPQSGISVGVDENNHPIVSFHIKSRKGGSVKTYPTIEYIFLESYKDSYNWTLTRGIEKRFTPFIEGNIINMPFLCSSAHSSTFSFEKIVKEIHNLYLDKNPNFKLIRKSKFSRLSVINAPNFFDVTIVFPSN